MIYEFDDDRSEDPEVDLPEIHREEDTTTDLSDISIEKIGRTQPRSNSSPASERDASTAAQSSSKSAPSTSSSSGPSRVDGQPPSRPFLKPKASDDEIAAFFESHAVDDCLPNLHECLAIVDSPRRISLLVQLIENSIPRLILAHQSNRPGSRSPFVPTAGKSSGKINLAEDSIVAWLAGEFPELREMTSAVHELILFEFAIRCRCDLPIDYERLLEIDPSTASDIKNQLARMSKSLSRQYGELQSRPTVERSSDTVAERATGPLGEIPVRIALGSFFLKSHLASGGMGAVYKAIDMRTGAIVALKATRRKDSWSVNRFYEEVRLLSSMRHPNLVEFLEAFHDGDECYFSMRFVHGENLSEWWSSRCCESDAFAQLLAVLYQLGRALLYLHSQGIANGDVKPRNILVDSDGYAVMVDFGLARVAQWESPTLPGSPESKQPIAGTLTYMSAEVRAGGLVTQASDCYSLGCIIGECLDVLETSLANARPNGSTATPSSADRTSLVNRQASLRQLSQTMRSHHIDQRPSIQEVVGEIESLSRGSVNDSRTPGQNATLIGRRQLIDDFVATIVTLPAVQPLVSVYHGTEGLGLTRFTKSAVQIADFPRDPSASPVLCLPVWSFGSRRGLRSPLVTLIQSFISQTLQKIDAPFIQASEFKRIAHAFAQFEELKHHVLPSENPSQSTDNPPNPSDATAKQSVSHPTWSSDVRAEGHLDDPPTTTLALFCWLLSRLSQRMAVLVVIDGWERADGEVLELVREMLAKDAGFRGQLLLCYTGAGLTTDRISDLYSALGDPSYFRSRAIAIKPFGDSAMRILIERLFSSSTALLSQEQQLSNRSIFDLLLAAAAGNPLRLVLIHRLLTRKTSRNLNWAERIERYQEFDLDELKIRQFVRRELKAVELLAVARGNISGNSWQMVSKLDPAELLSLLQRLEEHGWVSQKGKFPDLEIKFEDETVRRKISERMASGQLERRHFRWATLATSEAIPIWETAAHHYELAKRFDEASACWRESVASLLKLGRFEEADRMATRAFDSPRLIATERRRIESLLKEI
jgi:serine/threonine protein kinase